MNQQTVTLEANIVFQLELKKGSSQSPFLNQIMNR